MQALLDAIASMEFASTAQRIFHGRGGLYPGCEQWTLDVYPPVVLLTSFQPAPQDVLDRLLVALQQRHAQCAPAQAFTCVYQCRHEGALDTRILAGTVPDLHVVSEGVSRYRVHLTKGQNHGLFLDMAQGRSWVREYVAQRRACRVLNLFAYTCAFSVVALQAGARHVVNVDMSQGALATGQQNHQLNGVGKGASFLAHDIFSSWGKITRSGPYDLVIMDPPSYQRGSFVASKDYARLLRRLPALVDADGHVLICLNAPELGESFLHDRMRECAPGFRFVTRVANPASFADVSEDRSLKVLVYAMAERPELPE